LPGMRCGIVNHSRDSPAPCGGGSGWGVAASTVRVVPPPPPPPRKGEGSPSRSHPVHRHRNLRAVLDGLVDHAITLGEFQQQIEFLLRRVGVDVETETNFRETNRRLLVDAERAAEIQIAL